MVCLGLGNIEGADESTELCITYPIILSLIVGQCGCGTERRAVDSGTRRPGFEIMIQNYILSRTNS